MMKAAGGSRWMADLIPDDWRKGILVPVYKGKCDPLVCVGHTELLSYWSSR